MITSSACNRVLTARFYAEPVIRRGRDGTGQAAGASSRA